MNEIKIEIPAGKEVDWEASAQQRQIVFKDKFTYENVCKELFKDGYCYTNTYGEIQADGRNQSFITEPNTAKTTHQLECVLAKNKLANIAVCLNKGWKPNLNSDFGCCITLDHYGDLMIERCGVVCPYSSGQIMFKSSELAIQAIEILGEETIKLALKPLY